MKEKSISEKFKYEWIMREYGSYEDSTDKENHVVAIISRSPKNKVRVNNDEEQRKIEKSASFVSDGYDDDHQLPASRSIARFINF